MRRWFTPLDLDALVAGARRRTGLNDLGEDDWREPLALLLTDLERDRHLTDLGAVIASRLLLGLLSNRLRTAAADTASTAAPPTNPLVILGLPRTGSTLLHELLALHPAFRAPTFAECESLPAAGWQLRRQRTSSRLHAALMNFLAPDFRWIHRVRATHPHECVTIQALSFRSMQFHALLHLPEYSRWLAGCDWRPAYRWHARYLSLLGLAQTRWVLKAPGHMHGIDALLEQYPEALFVQLHRDPRLCVPSMASLYATLRQTTRDVVDRAEIGRHICREWSDGLERIARARADKHVDARFLDIQYADLVKDPVGRVSQICEFADAPLDNTSVARMRAFLERNRVRKGHQYSLEQFGLDAAAVDAAFTTAPVA